MKRSLIELTFYEMYYFADIVKDVLEHGSTRSIWKTFIMTSAGSAIYRRSPKFSAFHSFIRFVIDAVMSEAGDSIKLDLLQDKLAQFEISPDASEDELDPHPSKLTINLAMERLNIRHGS